MSVTVRRLGLAALFLLGAVIGVAAADTAPPRRVFEFEGSVCVEIATGWDCDFVGVDE